MRTTLDIDGDVLQAAKEIAARQRRTAGEIISELARKGLATQPASEDRAAFAIEDGWVTLRRRGDAVVTSELVSRLLADADFADAGLQRSKADPD